MESYRLLALEQGLHQLQESVRHQQRLIKLGQVKTIHDMYYLEHADLNTAPLHHCQVMTDLMEKWCYSMNFVPDYKDISFYREEMELICRAIYSHAHQIELHDNLFEMAQADQVKAKVAYLFAVMSIEELMMFGAEYCYSK